MKDVNTCILTGNLGKDADLRYTQGGTPVLNFSLANDQSFKDENQVEQKRVNWVNCVIFGKRAEAVQKFLKKGAHILIEGKISVRQYQDKSQQNRTSTEIVVDREGQIQVLRFVNDENGQRAPAGNRKSSPAAGHKPQNDYPDALGGNGPAPAKPPLGQEGGFPEDADLPF